MSWISEITGWSGDLEMDRCSFAQGGIGGVDRWAGIKDKLKMMVAQNHGAV